MTLDKNETFKNIATTVTNVIKTFSLNAELEIDKRFKIQLATSIYLLTHIYTLLNYVANHPNQNEISDEKFESQIILWQACNTMLGALQLMRQGYPLEPQFLMRVAIESSALAMSFHLDSNSYSRYQKGNLTGKDCITPAKKTVREIGQIYGLLSDITHPSRKTTGNNYNAYSSSLIIGGGYSDELSNRTLFNFSLLNYLVLTIWKCTEFILYEFEDNPMFWEEDENGYNFRLNENMKNIVVDIKKDFESAISQIKE